MARTRIRGEEAVRVQGLDQFRREMTKIAKEGGPDGRALLKAANQHVADHVRVRAVARAATVGKMQHKAALSMKSGRAANAATITGGNAKVPFFAGAEFGAGLAIRSKIGGVPSPRSGIGYVQFLPWKEPGFGNTGYFLFPTMRFESKRIIEMYGEELDKITKHAFPD